MDYEAQEDEDANTEQDSSRETQPQEKTMSSGRMGNQITFDPSLPGTHSVSF